MLCYFLAGFTECKLNVFFSYLWIFKTHFFFFFINWLHEIKEEEENSIIQSLILKLRVWVDMNKNTIFVCVKVCCTYPPIDMSLNHDSGGYVSPKIS